MNTKINIFLPVIFSGLLALSTFPAHAVSPNSSWFANRDGNAGITQANMSLSATTFCFLSRVNVEDTDTNNEFAECVVERGPNVWTLKAILGPGGGPDAAARCRAYCYNK